MRSTHGDSLRDYRAKRNFKITGEPAANPLETLAGEPLAFVIQKHAASTLHYDLRLELDGVMRSWAVPKGPSVDPKVKRMAIEVEDHPLAYNRFEGTIPAGQYGAGTVIIWDRGRWEPLGDPRQGLRDGKLAFRLHGEKLNGLWELIRTRPPAERRQVAWLLFKKHDEFERSSASYDVLSAQPGSVVREPASRAPAKAPPIRKKAKDPAPRAKIPGSLAPQLATLAATVPPSGEWIYEVKYDGYRMLSRIAKGKPRLFTRSGLDWSRKFPALIKELTDMRLGGAWLDGECVVMGEKGAPDFGLLQAALEDNKTHEIQYFLFDAPFLDGRDLRELPLSERRARLRTLLSKQPMPHIRFSEDFVADARNLLASACKMNLEGILAKRADSPYCSQRSNNWLKLKCGQRQEFVVGGFTDRKGESGAVEIGSLLLGVYTDAGRLEFVGGVGTGWDQRTAAALKKQLLPALRTESPFEGSGLQSKARRNRGVAPEKWVKPAMVVEIGFAGWTPYGQLRQATFKGVRNDKRALDVRREKVSEPAPVKNSVRRQVAKSGVSVTHGDRVIDPSTGITKIEVVRYYESIASRLMPHLQGRACALLRAPNGIGGAMFFQKHLETLQVSGIKAQKNFIEVAAADGIVGAAQMNTLEFHTGNARFRNLSVPDRVVFDLDPGEGVAWRRMQQAARLIRSFLRELALESWLKTSGGNGLHVVVPLARRHDWNTVKRFANAVAAHIAQTIPDRFVAKSGAAHRVGKIYVDYLRNSEGATTVAAFSVRARPGLGVSMPLHWDALDFPRSSDYWNLRNAQAHLSAERQDPWADYAKACQSLTVALKRFDR